MNIYKRKFYFFNKKSFGDKMINSFFSILIINWLFQGLRGMQTKELIFRIFLELLIIILASIITNSLVLSIIAIHTLFFIFNCQFWLICRYSLFYKNNLIHLNSIAKKIIKMIKKRHSINECVIIGSLGSKTNFKNTNSDLDIRFFFNNGVMDFF